jgi:hypothetical protein
VIYLLSSIALVREFRLFIFDDKRSISFSHLFTSARLPIGRYQTIDKFTTSQNPVIRCDPYILSPEKAPETSPLQCEPDHHHRWLFSFLTGEYQHTLSNFV